MKIHSERRRRWRSSPSGLALGAAALLLGLHLVAAQEGGVAIPGEPCLAPEAIKGLGSVPQTELHLQHFIPRYEETCPSGVGKMTYDALGDAAAVRMVMRHENGKTSPVDPPYLIYAMDLPLTSFEKYSAEMDLFNPFRARYFSFVNHLPMYVYGVAVGYNLGSCDTGAPLKLSTSTLSLIYSGGITKWNDPILVFGDPSRSDDDNPFLESCNMAIDAARRLDEAAATIVFKDYLSQGNPTFHVYKTKELNTIWPQTLRPGCRGRFDSGMSTCLDSPGTIGYVLYQEAYVKSYQLAHVQNVSGQFVAPATVVWPPEDRIGWPDECVPASQGATVPPAQQDWSRTTLTATRNGYPICAFGYMLTFQRPAWAVSATNQEIRTLVDYLTVAARDDVQEGLSKFHVAPITPNVRTVVRTGINNITNV